MIVTQLQPVNGFTTDLTLLDPVTVHSTDLGTLQTELSGTFSSTITLINTGLLGPEGPPGGGYYRHDQAVAATPWVINHNFGYRPNVKPFTVGGVEVLAELIHTSDNQAQILFDSPLAGYAICS
jgi:hypothetical protein